MNFAKSVLVIGAILLVLSGVILIPNFDYVQAASGTCFPSGPVTISTSMSWTNLICSHTGDVTFVSGGSLTMVNSSLLENNGSIVLSEVSSLSLTSSSLNISGTGVSLEVNGNSMLTLSSGSLVNGGPLVMSSEAVLRSSNSQLNLLGLNSTGSTTLVLNSTRVYLPSGFAGNVSASEILFDGSSFAVSGVSKTSFNGSSSVTLINSRITASGTTSQLVSLTGTSLSIVGSSITDLVNSTSLTTSSLVLNGGEVSIFQSSLLSSNAGSYGFPPVSISKLFINASLSLVINQSTLIAGQATTASRGLYGTSSMQLSSTANITILSSTLESLAQGECKLLLSANSPITVAHYISLNQTLLEEQQNPGNITIESNNDLLMSGATIHAKQAGLAIRAYSMIAIDSNITVLQSIGTSVGTIYAHNSTFEGFSLLQGVSSYLIYQDMSVKVVTPVNSGSVADAAVSAIDPTTGETDYSTVTNANGLATISAIVQSENSTGITNHTSGYIIQAYSGGQSSNQLLVLPAGGSYASLTVSGTSQYSFSIQQNYLLGSFGPIQSIGIVSNSYPLGFFYNATHSELDFRTVGNNGYNFTYTVFYPTNMSSIPMGAKVDGFPVAVSNRNVNSSYSSASFTIPSGSHQIALTFASPNGFFLYQTYPYFFPGPTTIISLVILVLLSIILLSFYIKRRKNTTEPT